jgi:hypothetical protein
VVFLADHLAARETAVRPCLGFPSRAGLALAGMRRPVKTSDPCWVSRRGLGVMLPRMGATRSEKTV